MTRTTRFNSGRGVTFVRHKFTGLPGCDAFPKGIPHDLAIGNVQHEEPYPGDNGILFELREDLKDETTQT
jgi:hypothetical protein